MPIVPGPSSSSTLTYTFTGLATPTSIATATATASAIASALPRPSQSAAASDNITLTLTETIVIFGFMGIIFLASIFNAIHFKKKYILEKKKREALTEMRSNPLSLGQSQMRSVLPLPIYT